MLMVFLRCAGSRDMELRLVGVMMGVGREEDLSLTTPELADLKSYYCLFCYSRGKRRDERAGLLAGQPSSDNSVCSQVACHDRQGYSETAM